MDCYLQWEGITMVTIPVNENLNRTVTDGSF
jgi:hypothetical protein